MRLAKYLAHCGVASRRRAEELIAAGRVRVGGEPSATRRATSIRRAASRSTAPGEPGAARGLDGQQAGRRDLDGARARTPPGGDRAGRLAPPPLSGRPARRGLDGADPAHERRRAREPAHPSRATRFQRTYRTRLRRAPTEAELRRLRAGVELDDGPTAPAKVARGVAAGGRDHDPRGPQPTGAEDGRGGRQRGRLAAARRVRLPAARRACGAASLAGCAAPSCGGSGKMRVNGEQERLWAVRGAVQADRNDEPSILARDRAADARADAAATRSSRPTSSA